MNNGKLFNKNIFLIKLLLSEKTLCNRKTFAPMPSLNNLILILMIQIMNKLSSKWKDMMFQSNSLLKVFENYASLQKLHYFLNLSNRLRLKVFASMNNLTKNKT